MSANLINNWKKSFEFYNPGEFKLFCLATLNTFIRSIKILAAKFWWLYLAVIALNFVDLNSLKQALNSVSVLLTFFEMMTVRPSLEAKDHTYFAKYIRGSWVFFIPPLFGIFIAVGCILAGLSQWFAVFCYLFAEILIAFPLYLFFLDSNLKIKDAWHAVCKSFKMFALFAPIQIPISMLLAFMLSYTTFLLATATFTHPVVNILVITFLVLITKCIEVFSMAAISVIYTKLKHQYFNVLFQE